MSAQCAQVTEHTAQNGFKNLAMDINDLISVEKDIREVVQTWKHAREERKKNVELAKEAAQKLDLSITQLADTNHDASSAGIPLRQTPGRARLASGPRVRNRRPISVNEFRCKYTRHSIKIDCWIKVQVSESQSSDRLPTVIVKWLQHITQIQRTLELSARNIIGAKLDLGRNNRVTLHCLTSPSLPLGPDSTCDHEQHEFEFDDPESARRCADYMEQVAEAVLPCTREERILFVVNPVEHFSSLDCECVQIVELINVHVFFICNA